MIFVMEGRFEETVNVLKARNVWLINKTEIVLRARCIFVSSSVIFGYLVAYDVAKAMRIFYFTNWFLPLLWSSSSPSIRNDMASELTKKTKKQADRRLPWSKLRIFVKRVKTHETTGWSPSKFASQGKWNQLKTTLRGSRGQSLKIS